MPFKSDSQRRFMYAKHPKIAKEFSKETPKWKDLPEKVDKKSINQWVSEKALAKKK